MITTVHVAIHWSSDKPGTRVMEGPVLHVDPVERLSIRDPRVLLGVQQVLARRNGVTQAPDLVSANGTPYFVVALDDRDPGNDKPWPITSLGAELTEPIRLRVVFAADGGWKTVLVDIDVEVI